MTDKRLFLLDAYALIFRAYYALIKMPRTTQDGFNTSAVFGFVNSLEELLKKEKPTHIAVCFDPPGPTFRHEADASYKAEREATPEDIRLSVPIIKEIIRAYRIPSVEVEGFEADDVIGTLAKRAEKEGFTTYMMTPDKDFGQLVSPNVLQYKPAYKGQDFEVRGEKEVCERYGIKTPGQVADLLALMGDKADNIPGCPGVGEKTAARLIQEFGGVDALLENTARLKGALKKKVEENADKIRFSKWLATIRTDAPVAVEPESLVARTPDKEKLFAIFKELEFKSLTDRVRRRIDAEKAVPAAAAQPSLFDFDSVPENEGAEEKPSATGSFASDGHRYEVVETAQALDALRRRTETAAGCGVFIPADGDTDFSAKPVGFALSVAPGEAFYIPAGFKEGEAFVLDLLARADIEKTGADCKRIYVAAASMRGDGAEPLLNYYDIGLAHYLLQPDMRHGIELLAQAYLGFDMLPWPAQPASRGVRPGLAALGLQTLADLACQHADVALRLRAPLGEAVKKEGMESMLEKMELPLLRVLARMEMAGVRIDVEALEDAAGSLRTRLDTLEKEIHALAGEEFNIGSPAKVGEILFDRLALDPKAKKTKTGQYSTSEEVLEKVAHKSPIVGKILEHRQLKKLLSTYLTALPAAIDPRTGKIHTNYNQTVTATGRISSSSPNLQNIPVRDDIGREIRRAFIADPGHLFLSADYSQIELRLVADFSGDETMTDAFAHGKDIHAITAAKIYHTSAEKVTDTQRRHAKTANFGILYGISAFGLASRLNIPRSEAKELIDSYFDTFPTIKRYMNESVEHARENGYVATKMGRKRFLPDINSKNPVVRGYAERNAVNAPIQGSAADIIKCAMVAIADEMERKGMESKMIMQVHDELNFDVVPEELPALQELVGRQMEAAYSGNVRLTASSGTGTNWLDAH